MPWCIRMGTGGDDNADNLEWREATPELLEQLEVSKMLGFYKSQKITATADGDVFQNGQKLTPHYSRYDADLDWIYTNGDGCVLESINVDELMYAFGHVHGNKFDFNDPCILHKDNDVENYASDNLEWCDRSDQRWKDYQVAVRRWRYEKELRDNLGKPQPATFKDKYRDLLPPNDNEQESIQK